MPRQQQPQDEIDRAFAKAFPRLQRWPYQIGRFLTILWGLSAVAKLLGLFDRRWATIFICLGVSLAVWTTGVIWFWIGYPAFFGRDDEVDSE